VNAYLVDDEPLALRRMTRLLEDTGRVAVVGSSSDALVAAAELERLKPDVLFLDIEMPGLTGFEFLRQLKRPPLVIFTTAYQQYALEAFEANSIDYLLKPVRPEALDRALTKAERMLSSGKPPDAAVLLAQVRRVLGDYPSRVASRLGDKVEFVELAGVSHFFAKDKLTFAATANKNFVVDQTIAELEAELDPKRWLRIHRAILVNADFVKEMHSSLGGRAILRLKDGKTDLHAARERTAEIRTKLGL